MRRAGADSIEVSFRAPGFSFVSHFLALLLALFVVFGVLSALLTYYLEMDVSVQGSGIVRPKRLHRVKSPQAGIVAEVRVSEGQIVGKGDVLVELKKRELEGRLEKIQAEILVNRSKREEIEAQMAGERNLLAADLDRIEVELRAAMLNLERVKAEQQLYSETVPERVALRRPIEELFPVREATILAQQKESERLLNQRRFQNVRGRYQEIVTLRRSAEQLTEEVELLKLKLRQTAIRAEFRGRVISPEPELRIGDQVQAGEVLLEVAQEDHWEARVVVNERDLPKLRYRQQARVFVEAYPHLEYRWFPGVVEHISRRRDEQGYAVTISIRNPEVEPSAKTILAHGMSAQAQIVVERGRIATILWRKLVKQLSHVAKQSPSLSQSSAGT